MVGEGGPGERGKAGKAGDPVVQEDAARPKQAEGLLEIFLQPGLAHVLEHPHADQLVVAFRRIEFPIVAHFDPATVGKSGPADPFVCQLGLGLVQRDPVGLDAVLPRRVEGQSSPSASDVEQAFAPLQPQLPADVVQLPFLGGIQVVAGVREIPAGVHHPLVQPQGIEFVGHVVVIGDGLPVPPQRVEGAAQPFRRTCSPMTVGGRQGEQETRETKALGQAQADANQAVREDKRAAEVPFDIEIVIKIRFTEGELLGDQNSVRSAPGVRRTIVNRDGSPGSASRRCRPTTERRNRADGRRRAPP